MAGAEVSLIRIDGYVEGANVFVDFNFNLIQDEGEPSGVFNSTTYEYEFTESDFGSQSHSVSEFNIL